jgi:FkbM family methyltransferase
MIRAQLDAIRWVTTHPLNRGRRTAALARWAAAQARAGVLRSPRLVPFVDDTHLYVGRGLTSANMQHYAGLGEPDVLGFVMHYLREGDVFADVGANVGVLTVLAAGVAGARTVAIEPDPRTFDWLERNIEANGLGTRVRRIASAVGDVHGELRLTAGLGAANRAATAGESGAQSVPCDTLDELLKDDHPTVLKADVEGFELPMLRGAAAILDDPRLQVVLLELKNHGARYGYDEDDVRALLARHGFQSFTYDPVARHLTPLEECECRPHNTIFVRNPALVIDRLRAAPRRRVIWDQRI